VHRRHVHCGKKEAKKSILLSQLHATWILKDTYHSFVRIVAVRMQSYPHRHHQIVGAKVPLSSPIDNQAWDIGRGLERAEYIEAFNFSMVGYGVSVHFPVLIRARPRKMTPPRMPRLPHILAPANSSKMTSSIGSISEALLNR